MKKALNGIIEGYNGVKSSWIITGVFFAISILASFALLTIYKLYGHTIKDSNFGDIIEIKPEWRDLYNNISAVPAAFSIGTLFMLMISYLAVLNFIDNINRFSKAAGAKLKTSVATAFIGLILLELIGFVFKINSNGLFDSVMETIPNLVTHKFDLLGWVCVAFALLLLWLIFVCSKALYVGLKESLRLLYSKTSEGLEGSFKSSVGLVLAFVILLAIPSTEYVPIAGYLFIPLCVVTILMAQRFSKVSATALAEMPVEEVEEPVVKAKSRVGRAILIGIAIPVVITVIFMILQYIQYN